MLVTTITNFRSPNRLSIYTNLSQWYKIWGMAYEKWKLMFIFPLPVSFVDAERCSDAFFSVRGSVWFVWQLPSHPGISLFARWKLMLFSMVLKISQLLFFDSRRKSRFMSKPWTQIEMETERIWLLEMGPPRRKKFVAKKTFTARWKPNSLCNQSAVAESRKRLRLAVTSSAH